MPVGTPEAQRAVEAVVRDSYGRLVSFLAARSRDVAGAEDALGEAFRAALETWPERGVPDNPDGWLFTAARRHLLDGARRAAVRADAASPLRLLADELAEVTRGTFDLFSMYIGVRLGFYEALATGGPLTSAELASRTGTAERYAREWLEQQTVAGILEVDDEKAEARRRRFGLPTRQRCGARRGWYTVWPGLAARSAPPSGRRCTG